MTLEKGVLNPAAKDKEDMFIGWAGAPAVDRRFLLVALPASLAVTTGAAYAVASNLSDPGAGAWLTNATHSVTGVLVNRPYPMIYTADPAAPDGVRTVLVVAQGKCTSGLDLAGATGRPVRAEGVLIQRKERQMLEVPLFVDEWLFDADGAAGETAVAIPQEEPLGTARLAGNIMDSKCFFGVMRPGRGKTHKACASLCIRGGIPPSFWARTDSGREVVMLMTDADGNAFGEDILPFVADPVEAEGAIVRVGDILQFRADVSDIRRT